ncbi:MAG: hypothetical protein CME19_10160 [Gemmatimonadetes bacterium]|nr:hypothetical protein [Gemmatimonadota bacterium]|tara:strand:- start:295 stop:954 length:660 start_codon:yes stop_codon:yes gene_type:complete
MSHNQYILANFVKSRQTQPSAAQSPEYRPETRTLRGSHQNEHFIRPEWRSQAVRPEPPAPEDLRSGQRDWVGSGFGHPGGCLCDRAVSIREPLLGRGYTQLSWTALFLAGLGILGLAMYESEQRRKEVGLRKLLGASVASIVRLSWRQNRILVGIALLIAWPVTVWMMRDWLSNFAHRVELGPVPLVLAGAAARVLFLAVIGSQAVRVGKVDPVVSLPS